MQTIDENTKNIYAQRYVRIQAINIWLFLELFPAGRWKMRFLPQLGRTLEDGAHPEKQNEERNQQTRSMCEIGATQTLHQPSLSLVTFFTVCG